VIEPELALELAVVEFDLPAQTGQAREALGRGVGGQAGQPIRTCLTLPFWRQLVPPMRYVICLRNPVDVAQSLAHALSFEQGVRLWLLYVRLALAQTVGEPRLFVFYEDLVTDWREQLQRLGHFVGRGQRSTRPETTEAVSEFVGEELWHHRTALVDVIDHPSIPFETKALYLVLRAAGDDQQGSAISRAVLDSFASAVESDLSSCRKDSYRQASKSATSH